MVARTRARTRRIVATLAATLLVLTALTACTPEIKGITGLTVDADGRLLAALAWCADKPPDVIVLTAARAVSPTPSGVPVPSANWPSWPGRDYDVPRDATSPATVQLPGFPSDPAPDRRAAFRMYGVADNSSFTTHAVTFRLPELAGLRPGSVMTTAIVSNDEVPRYVSLDEFARLGRAEC
ncbi:hypothetical protein [Micromonospora sediminimaris]|nr:hypothetical protein [Micromonospora sediminimaris]SFC14965.1 hypothetical protein SAMN05216284_10312 [Micromonospora sediminimaris]